MGQVYQATDTKLNRQVALKILPEAFAEDPDRLARFQREAQVLASLNHPNIAQIHGIEEADDTRALVLELVEGPTLADRISQGPIPVDEALPIAKQIAEALEAAHEQGVIHRDLKPANIKVREDGTVKVLDFGLAKAFQSDVSDVSASMSPTISLTAAATQMGMVIGTAAYMAPEQASGKVVDKRADVWAFGVVLYEMLTGTRPFAGDDVSKTLAHVIAIDPDWSTLPNALPPVLTNFLRGCLEKEPRKRIRDIGDVRLAMEGAFETVLGVSSEPVAAPQLQVWQRPIPAATVVLAIAALVGLAVWVMSRPDSTTTPTLMTFAIDAPLSLEGRVRDLTISSDGTQVIYKGPSSDGQRPQLHLRPIDQLSGTLLRGGEGGIGPFVSPGGEWVGFSHFQRPAMLQRVSIFGGPPVTLTEAPSPIFGASWGTDDQIIFGTGGGGLFRVSAGGGEPEALTTLDGESGSHTWPFIIPDREAVVFVVSGEGPPLTTGQLAVLDLDTREVTLLGLAGVSPHYVSTGHLVYAAEDGSVRAVPFDVTTLEVTGNPVPLVEGVAVKTSGAADFSVSHDGHLLYATGSSGGGTLRSLTWVDRDGREEAIDAPSRSYVYPRLSPDGTRVALDIRGEESDVWVLDLRRATLGRLTVNPGRNQNAIWSHDGERVAFSAEEDGALNIYWQVADGSSVPEPLTDLPDVSITPKSFSPDGTRLVFQDTNRPIDISVLQLDGGGEQEQLLATEFNEQNPEVSPDGRWLAYQSDQSGRFEVYVRPFPDVNAGGQWQISTDGGTRPLWSRRGSELFYWREGGVMGVSVDLEPTFTPGAPEVVIQGPYPQGRAGRHYDISLDDSRFLMLKNPPSQREDEAETEPGIVVVLNWSQQLLERVPID